MTDKIKSTDEAMPTSTCSVDRVRQARRIVEEESNARALACLAEVMQVVERRGCRIEAMPYFTAEGRVLAQFRVVAV